MFFHINQKNSDRGEWDLSKTSKHDKGEELWRESIF